MKDFAKAYHDLCFSFFDATAECNNALRRLPMCPEARILLDLQHRGISECAKKLRALQREEMGQSPE